jgi:nucleoside-diphosphate-sugar epimerase
VLVGDSSKLQEGLGWKPEIPLATSLVDTLDSYRARVLNVDVPNTRRT